MAEEQWQPVHGFEDLYEVSDWGRARSLPRTLIRLRNRKPVEVQIRGKILAQSPDSNGYMLVQLPRTEDGRQRNIRVRVNVLMLEAFAGPRPVGMVARHLNDVPDDNRLENLAWGTPTENRNDSVRNGTHGYARRTHCEQGHEFTPENTFIRTDGSRGCRECRWRRGHRWAKSEKGRARRREYMREYRKRATEQKQSP